MNDNQLAIEQYIKDIQNVNAGDSHEHTYRTPLENLMNNTKFDGKNITIVHEGKGKNLDIDGTPDFIIYENMNGFFQSLIGFIECKKIDYDLNKLINSSQIKKYSLTSENIIITNYREFILLQKGIATDKVLLINDDLSKSANQNIYQEFVNLLRNFYNYEYQYIKTKKVLAHALAAQSFYYSVALRKYIEDKTCQDEKYYNKFFTLFSDFQNSIQYYYVLEDFCDVYAQSLVYGLFLSRLENGEYFDEKKIDYLANIPEHFELLYEFLDSGYSFRHVPASIKQALINIGKNLNHIDISSIQYEFNQENDDNSDISVYLYEDFLKEYDVFRQTEKRKEGGVYYTPKEVTHFIVKAVNELIKSRFDLPDGYMSKNVKILDFACGTGTFIHSIYDIIFNQIYNNRADDLDKKNIKHKIMNDIYGFELLFTPYIVAHTTLSRFLKSKGIEFVKNDRLKIYLTNTLDIGYRTISSYLPQMKEEHEEAADIKSRENLLAIVGNPPYLSGKSQSLPTEMDKQIQQYKENLNEQNIRPLKDMYVKFIRFAEWKMEKAGHGVVGIITNNSFLDGITHRQMRKHLCETFDEIYILNLHGNSRKGENDKNIFDIMVGVCVLIFVKHKKEKATDTNKGACSLAVTDDNFTKVSYFSTLDNNIIKRREKLDFLETKKLNDVNWIKLNPAETSNYWFVNKDFAHLEAYNKFLKITDIFEKYNSGIGTANDEITVQYSKEKLDELKFNFETLKDDQILSKYKIKEKEDWNLKNAKDDFINNYNPLKINYRPLDYRLTSLSKSANRFLSRPRYEIMQHFDGKENLGLCFTRTTNGNSFQNIFISKIAADGVILGGRTYVAPLYLYGEKDEQDLINTEKRTNFTKDFQEKYIAPLDFEPTPEEILAYIYAVMHSPIYREKYIEFLKTDFPAVPMTQNKDIFYKYAEQGQKLINFHLLEKVPNDIEIEVKGVKDACVIMKIISPSEIEPQLKLITTEKDFITFDNVSPEIYNFEIGSYKPIEKWLKYRIKDEIILTIDDISHIKNMIIALKNTILIMDEIKVLGEEYLG